MDEITKSIHNQINSNREHLSDTLEKGRTLPVGTIKKRGPNNMIKTVNGWKYHSRANNAGKPKFNSNFSEKDYNEIMKDVEKEFREMFNVGDDEKFTPKMCNDGGCDMFAFEFKSRMRDAKKMITYQSDGDAMGHIWLEYKGKFYDAEIPQGVNSINKIPYIQRAKKKNKQILTEYYDG